MSQESFFLQDARPLVECAMGRTPADVVIRGGQWVCVQTGEIVPDTDIAILGERIAYVGPDASHTVGPNTRVIEAGGRFLVPGLLDAHMHVESGMLTVTEFVQAVIPHGTTAMFVDPHEIANVFGLKGVRLMVDEAALQPVHVWVQVPSCVPAAPQFEHCGAPLGPAEVAEAMTWPGVIGLGEMMDFPGVFSGAARVHDEMTATRRAHKVIGGHYASPDLGLPFHGYAAGGPEDDHEGTTREDAVARARQGMKVMMRYGSAWLDVAEQVRAVTENGLDPRHFILCTDDCHSETLVRHGHVDRAVKFAIQCGLSPVTAIQMATLNAADHFGLSREIGQIAPGRYADVLLVSDLEHLVIDTVIARGQVAAENGKVLAPRPKFTHPEWVRGSVRLPRKMQAADFALRCRRPGTATANVIGVIENQAPTRHLRLEVPVQAGEVRADPARDLAKLALIDRHHNTGAVQVGLVQGFGFTGRCAVASTVAHDCHQMIVAGTDETCMAAAADALAACGGGQVVVQNGQVIGLVALPVAGLMSDEPAETVAQQAATVLEGFRACGCTLNNPNMQLSLLALVVIPDLRITERGLVDVTQFKVLPVLE